MASSLSVDGKTQHCYLVAYADATPVATYTTEDLVELYRFLADLAGAHLYLT